MLRDMPRLLAAEIIFSLTVFALQEVPRGFGGVTLILVALLASSLPLLLAASRRPRPAVGPRADRVLVPAIFVLALAQLAFAIMRTVKPKIIDIGTTTLAAVEALAQGGNPYALPIDTLAGGIAGAADGLHGYKYLPMMLVAYGPFCLAMGLRGIVVANALLHGATAASVGALAARIGGKMAGLAAAALYLSLPFVAFQVVGRGVNDLVAVLPLLLALLVLERRPGLAGVLVGLSLAAKLMPGAAALLCLVPAAPFRRRYLAGVAAGLLPILPFVIADPAAFAANILVFNTIRPVDDTTWLYGLPGLAAPAARGVAVVALLAVYAWVWRRPPGLATRCAATMLAILVVFAVGPDMHHNYYLWFIPLLAVLAACAAAGPQQERP